MHVYFYLFLDMQYWDISSKTCTHLDAEEQEVYDPVSQIMTVKVFLMFDMCRVLVIFHCICITIYVIVFLINTFVLSMNNLASLDQMYYWIPFV